MEKENIVENQELEIVEINNVEDMLRLYPEADKETLAKIKNTLLKEIEDAGKGNRIIYGAKHNNDIVGVIQLVFKEKKDYYADGKTGAHIHHARVAENLRGQGIGTKLMEIAEKEARNRDFQEMTLGVEEDNKKTIKLYEKLGYKEFMREKGDEGETIVGMKKELLN